MPDHFGQISAKHDEGMRSGLSGTLGNQIGRAGNAARKEDVEMMQRYRVSYKRPITLIYCAHVDGRFVGSLSKTDFLNGEGLQIAHWHVRYDTRYGTVSRNAVLICCKRAAAERHGRHVHHPWPQFPTGYGSRR